MTITPQDIQNKEFREAFRGYNEDEVDTFLDDVAEEFGRVYQDNQRLRIQLATAQQEAAHRPPGPLPTVSHPPSAADSVSPAAPPGVARDRAEAREEMKRALVATQRAAEAALEEAKRRGAEILARAEQRAKEIDEMTARRAKDIDGDAATALTHAQQRVEELRRQENEIRGRLRRMLAEHVKVLQQLEGEALAASGAPQRPVASRGGVEPPPAGASLAEALTPAESPPAHGSPSSQVPPSGEAPQAGPAAGLSPSGIQPRKGIGAAPHLAAPGVPAKEKPMWLAREDVPQRNGGARTPPARPEAPSSADPASRAAVVERMTRELGDAAEPPAAPPEATQSPQRDTFWKR